MAYKRIVISEFGGPDVLKWVEEPTLPEPQAGEVRVKVLAASASFTDTMTRTGNYPGIKEKLPYPPGWDFVGVVDKLGPGASGFSIGQRVADLTGYGANTEYIVRPANSLVPVPDGLDVAVADATILSYTTAYQMLVRIAEVKEGQRILVHGAAGAVGQAFLSLGKLLGLEMYGTASGSQVSTVKEAGATPIDYRTEDFVAKTMELTGDGVDAVFDPIGVDHFIESFKTLRAKGKLVTYGFYNLTAGTDHPMMGQMMGQIMRFQMLSMRWNYFSGGKKVIYFNIGDLRGKHPDWFKEDLAKLFGYAAEGKIHPNVWRRMPMSEAAEAHRLIEARKAEGKIVLMTDAAE